jgi:hypothetical protein
MAMIAMSALEAHMSVSSSEYISKYPTVVLLYQPIREVVAIKNSKIPTHLDIDQLAFLTRIIPPRMARIGEKIHL